jgi:hypothetical protein
VPFGNSWDVSLLAPPESALVFNGDRSYIIR